MAPHSSTLAWKIPWMEEPGRLQSMGSLRVRHDWATSFTFHFHALEKEMATHSSVLAWKIPRTEEPGGLPSMGSHRVGHDWSDLAAAATTSTIPNWVRFIGKSFTRVTLQSTLLKKTPSPFRLYLPVTGLCLCGTELWKCSLPTFTCQFRFEERVPCSWILGRC